MVESKGEFSIRGSIIDFWPIEYDNPIRIELFDTEIDSIRFFDKDTQRSLENIDEIIVRPTKELIYDKNDYDNVIKEIKNDLSTISDDGKLVKIKDKYRQIISYLKDSLYIANDDLITPYRKNNFDSFF